MPIRSYLYDATATDQEIVLSPALVADLHDRQLLWVDIQEYEEEELDQVVRLLGLDPECLIGLQQRGRRPRLDSINNYFQLNIDVVQASVKETESKYDLIDLKFVVGCNLVLTVHRQPVDFLASFDSRIKGDSDLGELDAPAFLAALLDWHITSYFRLIEALEKQVDRIDAHALKPNHTRDLLSDLAGLRRQVGFIRRTLTPHREVYAAMTSPDFHLPTGRKSIGHYAVLNERLERAIEAVENARELIVGSFDIFTTQTALRTNEVIKALTLISFVWLPAGVLVGMVGLLERGPVYNLGRTGFWVMVVTIVLIGLSTVAAARWRRWI